MTSILNGAVTVKGANLMVNYELNELGNTSKLYELQHYETKILLVNDYKITYIKPCSRSSTRAINQALKYIFQTSDITVRDILKYPSNQEGVTIDRSSY